jgi:hypothetical protein
MWKREHEVIYNANQQISQETNSLPGARIHTAKHKANKGARIHKANRLQISSP